MLKQFSLDWKLNKYAFFGTLLTFPGAFLCGTGLLAMILFLDGEPSGWFPMGTVMAIMIPCIIAIVSGIGYPSAFNLALSMGRTRKEFMLSYALRQLLWLIVGYVLILLLHRLELAVNPILFADFGENEGPMDFLTDWRVILPSIAVLLTLNMFIGSVYSRYGKAGGWVLYALWMVACLGLPRLLHDGSPILAFLMSIPAAGWITIGIAVLAAMLAFILYQGRKQMVR